jgi:glycosyltransferase involved in cell wall biosynthesis
MRSVLFSIETSDPDGAEKMLINLAELLNKRGYRPVVCLLEEGWLADESRRCGYSTYVIPLERTVDFRWVRRASKMVASERIDIIHAHEFAMNTYCTLLAAIARVPCVATVHGKNYSSDRWHRRMAYRAVARCARMIAVSDDIKSFLATKVGVLRSRITTITNGIDIDRYSPASLSRRLFRDELGLSDDQPLIGCVGRLDGVKGHTFLVRAARTVCQRYPRAVFVLAGQGQLRDTLEEEANALGIGQNVRFLGYRHDVSAVLAALDIFVLPSLSEGLPLSLLEAMAASIPIVASNVGGIPEVVGDGQSGLLAEPGDPAGLAEKILMLLDNQALGKTIAQNARTIVLARFGVDAMVDAYERVYDQQFEKHGNAIE